MVRVVRAQPWLAAISLTYIAGFGLWGAVNDNDLTAPYLLTMALALPMVLFFESRFALGPAVLRSLALLGFVHMAGALVQIDGRSLYSLWIVGDVLRFDQLVHAAGTAAATFACGVVVRRYVSGPGLPVRLALIAALAGAGIASIQESIEFLATQVGSYDVGGFVNTGWDLVFNLAGATAAAVVLGWRSRRRLPGLSSVPRTGPQAFRSPRVGGRNAVWAMRTAGVVGLGAQGAFMVGYAIAGRHDDGFSYWSDPISRMGEPVSAAAWLVNPLLITLGIAIVVAALGLRVAGARVPAAMMLLAGLAFVGEGLVPCRQGCPAPWRGLTANDALHVVLGIAVVAGFIGGPLTMHRLVGGDPSLRGYGRLSRAAGYAVAAGLVAYALVGLPTDVVGITQLLMIVPGLAWFGATCLLLLDGRLPPAVRPDHKGASFHRMAA